MVEEVISSWDGLQVLSPDGHGGDHSGGDNHGGGDGLQVHCPGNGAVRNGHGDAHAGGDNHGGGDGCCGGKDHGGGAC